MTNKPYRAFNQGELKEFGRIFIAPLLHNRPPKQSLADFLEGTLFHKDERIIQRCKARTDFEMPGLWKITPYTKVSSGAPRKVKKDAECFVRFDLTQPGLVDVETCLGQGGREYVFELTDLQWISIKRNLMPSGRGKSEFERICP